VNPGEAAHSFAALSLGRKGYMGPHLARWATSIGKISGEKAEGRRAFRVKSNQDFNTVWQVFTVSRLNYNQVTPESGGATACKKAGEKIFKRKPRFKSL